MSDNEDKSSPGDVVSNDGVSNDGVSNDVVSNDVELDDLEWDDALADWEDELDDTAEARGAPINEPKTPPVPSSDKGGGARPLYRPPSPDDTFARRPPPIPRQKPATPFDDQFPSLADFDEEEESEATAIASIPQELIDSLVRSEGNERPTGRPPQNVPPPARPAPASAPAVDLELDGLLDDFDDAPTDLLDDPDPDNPPTRVDPGADSDAEDAFFDSPSAASSPIAPNPEAAFFGQGFEDESTNIFDPFEHAASGSAPLHPGEPGPTDDEEEALPKTRIGKSPVDDPEAVPRTRIVESPLAAAEASKAVPKPSIPRPSIPRPGGAAARPPLPKIPKPSIPRPGARKPPAKKPLGALGRLRPSSKVGGKAPPAPARLEKPGAPGIAKPPPLAPAPAAPIKKPDHGGLAARIDATFDNTFDNTFDKDVEVGPAPTERSSTPDATPVRASSLPPPLPTKLKDDKPLGADPLGAAAEAEEDAIIDVDSSDVLETDIDLDGPTIGEAVLSDDDDDDDDELIIEADDDDELIIEAGDDEDADLQTVVMDEDDEDDEDWSEEDWAALEAAEAEADERAATQAQAEKIAKDRGAAAARRSVRSRKPRDETFPMIGTGNDVLRLRKQLLTGLAKSKTGEIKARLLVSAAELAEQLGDGDEVRTLLRSALEADPKDAVALRGLRRVAVQRADWDDLAALFEKEAGLEISLWERTLALCGLAEVHLSRRKNPAEAEKAASAALELQPASIAATLLLAEARWRQGRDADAVKPFKNAREVWGDPDARCALAIEEARVAELAGDGDAARTLYAWANEVDPEALDGWFGRARTSSRTDADPQGAVEALATLAAYCGGAAGEAILTRASRVATRVCNDAALGVRLLGAATGVLPLQARADAAAATGDRELELTALSGWASAAGGTDRALALVRMAEAKAALDDLDGAEDALRDAARADGSLGTIRVVREVIARRSGDLSRLVDAIDSQGALASAARVASDTASLEKEATLLAEASTEGVALVTVDVLTLDVAAELGEDGGLNNALRAQADRVPPEQRAGSLLAMTDRAVDREDLDAAEEILAEARQLAPGDPLILRPLGRLVLRRDAAEAAQLWLEEASVSQGGRSAFAATQAGRLLHATGGNSVAAYQKGLEAVTGYGPAAWALRAIALENGDALVLGEVYEQLADTTAHATDRAAHLVRGALLRADADPTGAAELLERAREEVPRDAVLQSLLMRLSGATSAKDRAQMLARSAETTDEPMRRVFRLQAAAAYEEAGEHSEAAAEYRKVAVDAPEDAYVRIGLDRSEIAAGEAARVAERRFADVKEAKDEGQRVLALERLAQLDLNVRNDPASAVLSLQSILEVAPGHLPSLRALQRYFSEQKRIEDTLSVVEKLAQHVEPGPDVTALLRLARRLYMMNPESPGDSADSLMLETAERAELDGWFAPRLLAASRARGKTNLAKESALALAHLLAAPDERGSARIRAAELFAKDDAEKAFELLNEAVEASPTHPVAAVALAQVCEGRDDPRAEAEALEIAGRASEVKAHAAELFHRAGVLWQEKLQDTERALAALEAASERDVTFSDTFSRLSTLLREVDDKTRLANLFQHRLSAGGDTAEMVELYVEQASLRRQIQDASGAKSALRAALALQPEHIEALRQLAHLSIEDEDWRGAAEVLIRIARIRKEREELRWVFFTLGDIYDRHMPDPRRAEAAFRRVLKLLPQDVPAMERLAALYERENQLESAARTLEELAKVDVDPDGNRTHRLKLAEIFEQLGDARKAEQVLEAARKNAPTDLAVLRSLADFYQRQNASNAMAMHLNRAVNDFRHALSADLGDAAAWPGLVEVLSWRGHADAASAAASAAQSLGVVDVEMGKLVDARGSAPGAQQGATLESLDEILAPPLLNAPTRAVFQLAGVALEKSLPFDVAAYGAEKVGSRDTTIRPLAQEVGRWFGVAAPELYVTSAAPRVCVPVYSNPVTILVGSELLGITDDREKLFVLVRAFKIARAQLSVVVRAQPAEVVALIGGLVQSYDPHHVPVGATPAMVSEASRRVVKNIVRRVRDQLGPLVYEMAGRPGYDPSRLAMAASEWGNRCALIAGGSAPAAMSALAKLSGERQLPGDPSSRLTMLQRFPEAASLLAFAISDAHFEARTRAGSDRR